MAKKYTAEIKILKRCIEEMEKIKDLMWSLEDAALSIEKELCDIDASLPLKEEIQNVSDTRERAQLSKAIALLEQSFLMIDEILGPPQDEISEEMESSAITPEARGNGEGISLDSLLEIMKKPSKYHAS